MTKFFEKIRSLPELSRKIIFWSILILLGAALLFFFVRGAQNRFKNFDLKNTAEQVNPY